MSRYPHIRVVVRSPSALALVAAVRQELRRAGVARPEIERFTSQALAGNDAERARRICNEWVETEAPPDLEL